MGGAVRVRVRVLAGESARAGGGRAGAGALPARRVARPALALRPGPSRTLRLATGCSWTLRARPGPSGPGRGPAPARQQARLTPAAFGDPQPDDAESRTL